MAKPWTTERKIIAGFTAALSVLCIVAGVSVLSTLQLMRNWNEVSHAHQILDALSRFQGGILELAINARLYASDPKDSTFDDWEKNRDNVIAIEKQLRELISQDENQQARLRGLAASMDRLMKPTTRGGDHALLAELWKQGVLIGPVQVILAMEEEERNILALCDKTTRATSYETILTIGLASWLAIVLVFGSAILIMRDLRNRRKAEIELQRARQAAVTASIAKSAFLANMSHEVRTPLTAILGYADLLLASKSDERERTRYLLTMRRSGEHLLSIINDILDISKIEAGRMKLEVIECRLMDILADVDSLMRPRALAKGIDFRLEYTSPIPERILTDPTRLKQMVVNLAGNAVKFTEYGVVRIVIRYDATPSTPRVIVEVIDTGIGISDEQQVALFQPFAQADISTTRRYGGTGLGLSISRRLAQMMDGELAVSSEIKRGSTFRLSLPIAAAPGAAMLGPAEAQKELSVVRESVAPQRTVSARVLLAEDGPENRDVISLHLQRAGCEVLTSADGQAACERALSADTLGNPFDVILMDMQMPVMDGYTATTRLRAAGYKGAIIALTANAMMEDRDRCLNAGCDDYAAKPVDVRNLLQLIQRWSGRRTEEATKVVDTLLNDPVLRKLTQKFAENTSASIASMHELLAAGKYLDIAAAAHKLAGAGGSYGFHGVTLEAKSLERLTRNNAEATEILRQMERLETACLSARDAIHRASDGEASLAQSTR